MTTASAPDGRIRGIGRTLLRDYRPFVYGGIGLVVLSAAGLLFDTYPRRIADWTPAVSDPQIVRESAGLAGGTALVLAFCLVVLGVLWGIISVRNR